MTRTITLEVTKDELVTMYGGLCLAFEDLDSDMPLIEDQKSELTKMGQLRDRIEAILDDKE